MDSAHFTPENTDGFTQEELDTANEQIEQAIEHCGMAEDLEEIDSEAHDWLAAERERILNNMASNRCS